MYRIMKKQRNDDDNEIALILQKTRNIDTNSNQTLKTSLYPGNQQQQQQQQRGRWSIMYHIILLLSLISRKLIIMVNSFTIRKTTRTTSRINLYCDTSFSQKKLCQYQRHTHHQHHQQQRTSSSSSSILYMSSVFDFLKERSKEGMEQIDKLTTAAVTGNIKDAFIDLNIYTQKTNLEFYNSLTKSRNQLLYSLESIVTGSSSDDILNNLQDILIQSDLGISISEDIINEIKSLRQNSTSIISQYDLKSILRGKLLESLQQDVVDDNNNNINIDDIQFSTNPNYPTIIMVIGANGMGKTTTIGKLAYLFHNTMNLNVLMVAGDTYRAGAVEQLQQWSTRIPCDIVIPDEIQAKTPSAVIYKALDIAMKSKKMEVNSTDETTGTMITTNVTKPYSYDVILIDTSGRLSNNDALNAELVKMKKVIQKRLSFENTTITDGDTTTTKIDNDAVPHEILLILDAIQGNQISYKSTEIWNNELKLTGLIVTKLDGTAKGGSIVSIVRNLKLPIKFIGIGEKITDIQKFDRERYVDSLLGIGTFSNNKNDGNTKKTFNPTWGGGMKNTNTNNVNDEGKQLAKRLQEMRKERDERAKIIQLDIKNKKTSLSNDIMMQQQQQAVSTTSAGNNDNNINVVTGGGGGSSSKSLVGGGKRNTSTNNNKKKKKPKK